MKKIVIIGANSFQNPLILKAKEMGYETHVFAWEDGAVGKETADYFYPISITEKEQILEKCREIQPDGVATIGSDLANVTAQYLAKQLGLPCNSEECIYISTNKYAMREAFMKAGVAVPYFVKVTEQDDFEKVTAQMKFPVIVKPTDRSGSRGITKVDSVTKIADAVKAATKDSFEKCAVIEEYIEGEEYSCECISYQGQHTVLAVTKKYTTGSPHFIETGHLEPAPLTKEIYEKVKQEIPKALDALKIRQGASHPEFKISPDGEIRFIEIGSRMGGDCIGSHLVPLSTGYDFTKMVIQAAVGERPEIVQNQSEAYAAIRFIFSQEDFEIYQKQKANHPESLVFVSEIDPIGEHEVVDSSTRYGYFIMASRSMDDIRNVF